MASSKRERELARMRAERQAARRAAAATRRRKQRGLVFGGLAGVVVVAVAVGTTLALTGDDKATLTTSASPSSSATPAPSLSPTAPAAPGACAYTKQGTAAKPVTGLPPVTGAKIDKPFTATLTTNQGVIGLRLDTPKAPCTVTSFTFLAKQKYFDGTTCHRLTTDGIFVLQCGDPSATGSGGPGYKFADENLEGATYPAGTLAMANSGPGTNGSQFFLVYKDSQLPPSYTPFGTITKGLDVITKVAAGGSKDGSDGPPKIPVTLTRVTISG